MYVDNPGEYATPHTENVYDYVVDINNSVFDFHKSLKNKEWKYRNYLSLVDGLHKYCDYFKLAVPKYMYLNKEVALEEIRKRDERNAELEKTASVRQAKQREAQEKKNAVLIEQFNKDLITLEEDWIEGRTNTTRLTHPLNRSGRYRRRGTRYDDGFSQIRLRIKNNEVETSLGARVPVDQAKVLWKYIQTGHDIKGFKIGHYTVLGMNGTLKIGCHQITKEEMDRFTTKYGWNTEPSPAIQELRDEFNKTKNGE
jgi:hypothetical protein